MKPYIAVGLFLALLTSCATSKSNVKAAWEMEKQVTHVRSASGMSVQLMRWGPVEQQEALLFFSGFEHPWVEAGKPILHKVQACKYGQCYSTEVKGQPWTTLLLSEENAKLYLPFVEEDTPLNLSYVTGEEETLKPEALAKMFEGQKLPASP